MKDGILFFDIWTSFAPGGAGAAAALRGRVTPRSRRFRIQASVQPPTMLRASTDLKVRIRGGGERTLLFELSRYLKVDAVEADGRPVDFIQNPAIEGTQLRRKGNDLVAVVFPAPLAAGQELKLRFTYAGEVLSEAGNGLLYVGERGTWYPNFGLSPAQFEMEFHYPANWTLVATGKQVSRAGGEAAETSAEAGAEKVSRWASERPIPVAGFNLGKYVRAEAKAGNILVEAYGTKGVEKSFPKPRPEVVEPADISRHSAAEIETDRTDRGDSAASVAGARCAGGGGQGGQGHCEFLAVVWALSIWLAGADADAWGIEPGMARAGVPVELRISEPAGADGSAS